jgi:hypothetical protein
MTVYSAPLPAPASGVLPNIVITRDKFAAYLPNEALARLTEFVRLQVEEMQIKLREPQIISRTFHQFKGKHLAHIRLTWQSDQTRIMQWLAFIGDSDKTIIIITATASEIEFDNYKSLFAGVLGSIEFNG